MDLGGTDLGDPRGALVALGYPYDFDRLVIVDLPSAERHSMYRSDEQQGVIVTERGPVSYSYHSMVDLSPFEDESIDLIYSGQSIEHVTAEDGKSVMAEAYRVLRPGGYLAIDTPNGRMTRLQQDEMIDPDHKIEYTWAQLSQLILSAGFEISWAKGLNYAGESAARGRVDLAEVAGNCGLYDALGGVLHPGRRGIQAGHPLSCEYVSNECRHSSSWRYGAGRRPWIRRIRSPLPYMRFRCRAVMLVAMVALISLTHLVSSYGYAAIFLLSVLQSCCVPTSSESTLGFAGVLASEGRLNVFGVIAVAVAGEVVGAYIAWAVGRYAGRTLVDRYGSMCC